MDNRLLKRDKEVIEFIEKMGYVTTKHIKDYIFPTVSMRVCQRRLEALESKGYIKRNRPYSFVPYAYYIDKPKKQTEHYFILADFIIELKNRGIEIVKLKREFIITGNKIRADLLIAFRYNNKLEVALVEYDKTHKPDTKKYENMYREKTYKDILGVFPKIIYINRFKNIEKPKCIENYIYHLKEDFSNLDEVLKGL